MTLPKRLARCNALEVNKHQVTGSGEDVKHNDSKKSDKACTCVFVAPRAVRTLGRHHETSATMSYQNSCDRQLVRNDSKVQRIASALQCSLGDSSRTFVGLRGHRLEQGIHNVDETTIRSNHQRCHFTIRAVVQAQRTRLELVADGVVGEEHPNASIAVH